MKLLFDENLSPKLVMRLADCFPACVGCAPFFGVHAGRLRDEHSPRSRRDTSTRSAQETCGANPT
jgi:hypothetical protein